MKNLILGIIALSLFGCATNFTPVPTGGSKADGNVITSYQYGGIQKPIVDWQTSHQSATQRCQSWGYSGAEPFQGVQQKCIRWNGYGCNGWQIDKQYQCVGEN